MVSINIHARAKHLIKRHGTRNPIRIAKDIGIYVKYKHYTDTKGYFIKIHRNKFIVVNSALNEFEKRIVMAHELGHALLHNDKDVYFIKEHTLFPVGRLEAQANKFAAELLISDDEIRKDWTIQQMSCWLGVPEELVKYKIL